MTWTPRDEFDEIAELRAENARLREKLTELDTDFDDMRADRDRLLGELGHLSGLTLAYLNELGAAGRGMLEVELRNALKETT